MERLVEVMRRQRVAEALVGAVVIEERAQQRLFGLDVGGRMRRSGVFGSRAQIGGLERGPLVTDSF